MQNSPSHLPILRSRRCPLRTQQVSENKRCHIKLKRREENKTNSDHVQVKKMTRESTTDVWRWLRWIEVRIRVFEISLAWHRTTSPQATNYIPHCWKGNVSRSHTLFISPNTQCTFFVWKTALHFFLSLPFIAIESLGILFYNRIFYQVLKTGVIEYFKSVLWFIIYDLPILNC